MARFHGWHCYSYVLHITAFCMLTSSNRKKIRVIGPLWGNSPVTGDAEFDVFFDLRLNKQLSKQSLGWWLETPWRSLWRHGNGTQTFFIKPFLQIFDTSGGIACTSVVMVEPSTNIVSKYVYCFLLQKWWERFENRLRAFKPKCS